MASVVPVIAELYDLCALLAEFETTDRKLAALAERRQALGRRAEGPRAEVATLEKRLAQARETERAIERRLKECRQQIDRFRAQLQEVSSVREAESLQHQIDRLLAETAAAEDEGLTALTSWEESEKALPIARQALKQAEEEVARLTAQCDEELERLTRARALAESERAARRKGLDDATGSLWDLLSGRYGAGALAAVTQQGVCSGCDMSLMPAVRSTAMMMRELTRCPTCGRVLYDPERLMAEAKRGPVVKKKPA